MGETGSRPSERFSRFSSYSDISISEVAGGGPGSSGLRPTIQYRADDSRLGDSIENV